MKTPKLATVTAALTFTLAACSLPKPAPTITQHDLGGVFPQATARQPASLRTVQVVAQPLVATTAMLYREASQPTRRGTYALNRWAAPPAAMVETALQRQLAPEGNGRCRLQYSLSEFIIEVDAGNKARAVLAADAWVLRDAILPASGSAAERAAAAIPATALRRSFDVAVPLAEVSPAAGALAMRQAVLQLAEQSRAWLAMEPARLCAG